MIKQDDEGNAVCPPATSVEFRLSLGDHRPIYCRAQSPRLDSVHSSFVKERKRPSLIMKTLPQSRRVTKGSPDEKFA